MARNPFRVRASGRGVNDEQFVKMFAASAIDILQEPGEPWESLIYVRSAPGGGKTSLLRLLTPGPLRRAVALGDDQRYRAIREALQDAGVLDGNSAKIFGIFLQFAIEYRTLDDLGPKALPVFRALISARIVLATLKAVLAHRELSYPEDLARIRIAWTPNDGAQLAAEADGAELHTWASTIEDSVFDVMDELGSDGSAGVRGLAELDGLHWLADAAFQVDGQPLAAKPVLLLDDLQYLSEKQHTYFNGALTAFRRPLGIWAAERLEALKEDDLLAPGVREGRDYGQEIRLEQRWLKRGLGPYGRFLGQIADLRAHQADGFEDRDFFPTLAEERELATWDGPLGVARQEIEDRLTAGAGRSPRYATWIAQRRELSGSPAAAAVGWRALEILIARDEARAQRSFNFDQLTSGELEDQDRAHIQAAAELFISREYGIPYYFGRDRIAALSSSNIEQFVDLSGDLFEEIISASVLRRGNRQLSAERQQAILRVVTDRRWNAIPRGASRGHAVLRFLENMGALCAEETYKPTAPYAPGVTGIGIPMADRDLLVSGAVVATTSTLKVVREVLASCVAQNLLEARLDHKNKGERWLVLYLNRLLCLRFGLPLGYGGWRPRRLNQLGAWIDKPALTTRGRLV